MLTLTPTEQHILDMLADGFSDAIIADYLDYGRGPKTVQALIHAASKRNGGIGRRRLVFLYRLQRAGCLPGKAPDPPHR